MLIMHNNQESSHIYGPRELTNFDVPERSNTVIKKPGVVDFASQIHGNRASP
jgi:hypothetical protein